MEARQICNSCKNCRIGFSSACSETVNFDSLKNICIGFYPSEFLSRHFYRAPKYGSGLWIKPLTVMDQNGGPFWVKTSPILMVLHLNLDSKPPSKIAVKPGFNDYTDVDGGGDPVPY